MNYETQPINDIDLVLHIDFDEMPDIAHEDERVEWNLRRAGDVCRIVAQTGFAMTGFTGILAEIGEVPAWDYLGRVARHNGFDVYNSDSMFEVYQRSTVSATEREGDDMPRQTVQHRIQGEIDKINARITKLDGQKADLIKERDQLTQAKQALGDTKPSPGRTTDG